MFAFKTKPPTAAKAQETITRLETRLADARSELERCKSDYGAAAMAFEEDPAAGGASAVEKARKSVERARRAAEDAETMLAAARARHAEALAAEATANVGAKWDIVEKHAAERLQAAQDAEKAVARLVDAWQRMVVASEAIVVECPALDATSRQTLGEAALLTGGQVAVPLRLHMLKSGFRWAAHWPFGTHDLPTLAKRVDDANAFLSRLRNEGRSDAA
jgi:hypothetical protein